MIVDGVAVTVGTVLPTTADGISFRLSPAIGQGQTVTVSYTDPSGEDDDGAIQDAAGNDAGFFTTGEGGVPAVVNESGVDLAPPALASAAVSGSGRLIELVFDENLDIDFQSLPPASAFAVIVDGVAVTVGTVLPTTADGISFRLSPAIAQGQTVTVSYIDPSGGDDANAIQDAAGNDAADFTTGEDGVPAVVNESTVEDTRPTLKSAETSPDGGQVILIFDEPVHSDDGVFEVAYGGTTYALSAESIVGGTLRLLLPVAVEADQTVTVSAPANAVQDLFGRGNEAIDSQAVTNRVVVIESVAITSDPGTEGIYAIGDAIKATVTFSQAVTVTGTPELELDFDGEPRTADYDSGESSGAAVVFSYTVVENDEDGDGIAIGADSLALGGGTITAGGGPAHLAQDALAAAAGHRVDGVPPAPTGADTNADGTKVIVTFSEDLSTEDPVSHQYYQVGPPGQHPAVSASVANGNTVELTLSAITPISFTEDNLQVVYFGGSFAGAVRDVAGNAAASVSSVAVANKVTEPAAYVTGVEITSDPGPDGIYATGEPQTVTILDDDGVPAFAEGSAATRSVVENTDAGVDIGAAVSATDADGDPLTYTLAGTDAASFAIVGTSGQLQTSAALDHEAKSSYAVTVTADDGKGGTATIAVTITVTDAAEPPDAPAAPSVSATVGAADSLEVSWAVPANAGRPDITGYDLQ